MANGATVYRPYNDADGDGRDDRTGLSRADFESESLSRAGGTTPQEVGGAEVSGPGNLGNTSFLDLNLDGADDSTGLSQEDFDAAMNAVGGYQSWSDEDGDGRDDATNLDAQTFGQEEARRRAAREAATYRDEDGDGRDDATNLEQGVFDRIKSTVEGEARTRYQDDAASYDEAASTARDARTAGRAESERQAAADRYAREYEEYIASGGRTADLRAGRTPMAEPGTPGAPGYAAPAPAGGGGGGGGATIPGTGLVIPETGIGLVDSFTGATLTREEAEARRKEEQRRADWLALNGILPTADDRSVEYGEIDRIDEAANVEAQADQGSIEAQRRALEGFEDIYQSGGLTAADRGRLAQSEREMARGMRSQREADMAALRARGLGGSGASIASMLAAQQSGADMLADREAEVARRAEDRAISALGSASDAAGTMRDSSWTENSWNAQNLNEWNQRSAEHQRDVNKYNVGAGDKTRESASDALVDWYGDKVDIAAGLDSQYTDNAEGSAAEKRRRDELAARQGNVAGEIVDIFKNLG